MFSKEWTHNQVSCFTLYNTCTLISASILLPCFFLSLNVRSPEGTGMAGALGVSTL